MKIIKDKRTRQVLLHELRKATCLQVSIFDTCSGVIEQVLGHCNAVIRVIEVSPAYAGKQLTDADLDSILSGLKEESPELIFEAMNVPAPIGLRKKMQDIGNLSATARLTLLEAFQNAINIQAELLIVAGNLSLTLDCSLEEVERGIRELAIAADTGMEVGEMDLHDFLGEPEAEGSTRILGPIKPQKLN